MALMPISKLAPECAALPVTSKRMNTPPLRPVTAAPSARPGSELKHDPRGAGVLLDHRPRERRADLLVAGEQRHHRRRRAAEPLDGGQHEAVHHEAGLHVGDARPIGAVAVDLERPARRLALRGTRCRGGPSAGSAGCRGATWPTVAEMASPNFSPVVTSLGDAVLAEETARYGRRPRRRRPCRRSRSRCSPAPQAAPALRPPVPQASGGRRRLSRSSQRRSQKSRGGRQARSRAKQPILWAPAGRAWRRSMDPPTGPTPG